MLRDLAYARTSSVFSVCSGFDMPILKLETVHTPWKHQLKSNKLGTSARLYAKSIGSKVQDFKIAILVLNYNGLRYLRGFFESAQFLSAVPDADIVLVDNASWDESIAFVQSHYPWVRVVRNQKNYGWGEGYNQAIAALRQQSHSYSHYLFINNDVFVSKEWWEELKNGILRSPSEVAEWGCRALFAAPFVDEILFSAVEGYKRPLGVTAQFYQHEYASYGKESSAFHVRLQPSVVPAATGESAHSQHNYEYCLRVLEQNGDAFAIEINPEFHIECVEETVQRKWVRVSKACKNNQPEKNVVTVNQGQTLLIHRVLSDTENEVKHLIQNSGSGLNSNFEGYDLLSYLSCDTPQNHADVKAICGVCKVVKADVFHQLMGFDAQFFMYYEDTDFSLRLRRLGLQLRIIEKARLKHIHAGSSGAHTPFFARQVAWSLLYFQMRHASLIQRMRILVRYSFNALLEHFENMYAPAKVHYTALERYFNGRKPDSVVEH